MWFWCFFSGLLVFLSLCAYYLFIIVHIKPKPRACASQHRYSTIELHTQPFLFLYLLCCPGYNPVNVLSSRMADMQHFIPIYVFCLFVCFLFIWRLALISCDLSFPHAICYSWYLHFLSQNCFKVFPIPWHTSCLLYIDFLITMNTFLDG